MRTRRRYSMVATVAMACALWLVACGTAVPHEKIVAAAGRGGLTNGGTASVSATGSTLTGGAVGSGTGDTVGAGGGDAGAGGGATGDGAAGSAGPGAGAGATGGNRSGSDGGAAASSARCSGTGSTVVIGNIGSYSGLAGAAIPGSQQAIKAWSQLVNAHGGLHCHPVKLLSADDGGDPARALSLAKQMVESQGAIAFVSAMVPLSLSGIRPYLEQKHIPLVGGDVSLPGWIESPMIFPSGTDADSFRAAQVKEFASAGLDKLAIVYCGETPSCTQGAKYLETHPSPKVKIVYSAQVSVAQTNFTTECLQAKSKGATALYVASDGNSLIRIARDCAQQDYHPRYSAASIAVLPQMSTNKDLEGLLALIGNAPWFLTSIPGVNEFRQAMATYAPDAPITASALAAFSSGKILEAAASKVGAKPTSAELLSGLDAMHRYTADGLTPPLTFHAGRGSGPVSCYFLIQVKNGKWVAPNGASPKC